MSTTVLRIAGSGARPKCEPPPAFSIHGIPEKYAPIARPPEPLHQSIALKIAAALLRHAEDWELGRVLPAPCAIRLSRSVILQPDILFVRHQRRGIIGKSHLCGIPDLAVEVLSSTGAAGEYRYKKGLYSRFGIQELWMADPAQGTVEALLWSEIGYVLAGRFGRSDRFRSPTLPGFRLSLSEVFAV